MDNNKKSPSRDKKQPIKMWEKPKKLRTVKPSKYEQNERSVREHWRNVLKDLEANYKGEKFWETQTDKVKELVGPLIFQRITKMFELPTDSGLYKTHSGVSVLPSEQFYKTKSIVDMQKCLSYRFSMTGFDVSDNVTVIDEDQDEIWSTTTENLTLKSKLSNKNISRRSISRKSLSKRIKSLQKTISKQTRSMSVPHKVSRFENIDEDASTNDDLKVHPEEINRHRKESNPHYKWLYCPGSDAEKISWNSKYKSNKQDVSASDEFNKKSEILTKKIAKEFCDWWKRLGTLEFKSEIKRPENIEELFQVWFDERASQGLVVDKRILPCVLKSVAVAVGAPKVSCESVLKRQINFDIHAESSPSHTTAFDSSLPQNLKHVPPNNHTKEMWRSIKIPEDLKTMSCVWEDITHLTSTKAFQLWLSERPHLPLPPCLVSEPEASHKKQLFVIPSDMMLRDQTSSKSDQGLALPVSQFELEVKDVLDKVMNE